jgi:hypothetical protein
MDWMQRFGNCWEKGRLLNPMAGFQGHRLNLSLQSAMYLEIASESV